MGNSREAVHCFLLYCVAGPPSLLSSGTAKLSFCVVARDGDGIRSASNSFLLCTSSTHFVILLHYF